MSSLSETTGGAGRRRAAGVCLLLAPLADMLEMALWPVGSDGSTASELQAAAGSPGAFTAAWLAESAGAVLLVVGAIGLLGYLRNRGRVLAMVGTILIGGGTFGVLTGGGFNAAIVPLAQQSDRASAIRTLDLFNAQPLLPVFTVLILAGLLGAVLLAVAAVRGGLVRWWVPALVLIGIVAVPLLDHDLYGIAAAATFLPMAGAEILLGVGLLRARAASSPVASPRRSRAAAEPAPIA